MIRFLISKNTVLRRNTPDSNDYELYFWTQIRYRGNLFSEFLVIRQSLAPRQWSIKQAFGRFFDDRDTELRGKFPALNVLTQKMHCIPQGNWWHGLFGYRLVSPPFLSPQKSVPRKSRGKHLEQLLKAGRIRQTIRKIHPSANNSREEKIYPSFFPPCTNEAAHCSAHFVWPPTKRGRIASPIPRAFKPFHPAFVRKFEAHLK